MKRKKWERPRLTVIFRKFEAGNALSCCKDGNNYLPAGPSALARYCTSMRPDCRPMSCAQVACS